METLIRDLRYAFRMFVKRPVWTAAAVVCLGLGVGGVTLIFSLVNGVLLDPLPYPNAGDIYVLWQRFPGFSFQRSPSSGKEFIDFQGETRTFAHVAGLIPWVYDLDSVDPPQRLGAGRLSASGFAVLGVRPALGRAYTEEEEARDERLAVLSHAVWQRVFNADPDVLGRTVSLSGQPFEVIGVMASDFRPILPNAEIWVPLVPRPQVPRDLRGVSVLTRLADGVGAERARNDLDNLEGRFRQDYPELYPEGWGIYLETLHESVVGDVRGRLMAFLGAVFLVLLIACANVANLLLSQSAARGREVALRTAVGAGRRTLVRQLLTESLVLTGLGAVLGVALAYSGLRLIVGLELGNVPRLGEVSIDAQVLLFALALSVATGLLFGLVPALKLSRPDLHSALKEGGKSGAGGRRHPLRSLLVVGEVTLAAVVLTGTGLTLRSFAKLQDVDPGFRTDSLVTTRLILPGPAYRLPERRAFVRDLGQALESLPGVEAVALTSALPFAAAIEVGNLVLEGQAPDLEDPGLAVGSMSVHPGYFEAMGIPLLQGRAFTALDHEESAPVVVVDSAMAERLWPDESPLGRRLRLDGSYDDSWREVVGVVGHIRNRGLDDATEHFYMPFAQYPKPQVAIGLRTRLEPGTVVSALREAIRGIDPNRPLFAISTMEEQISGSLAGARFNTALFALSGFAALLLAAVGVYGVMSHSVAQRTAEIGMRCALGARRLDVLKLVVGQGMTLAAAGLGLGLLLAWSLTRLLAPVVEGLIFGITAGDLATFAAVTATLLVTALFANLVPARRAARVDPVRALREE